jgi:hypothetical protein
VIRSNSAAISTVRCFNVSRCIFRANSRMSHASWR